MRVPPALAIAAAWGWRILIVGVVLYLVVTFLAGIPVVSVPIFLALVFAALLHRPAGFLRRFLPTWLAALIVLAGALVVIGGILGFVASRVESNADSLAKQGQQALDEVRNLVTACPVWAAARPTWWTRSSTGCSRTPQPCCPECSPRAG